jgi:signal transduction histidine kinase
VANHVYRIAQEAVINAIKGGRATRINIRLFSQAPHLKLTVADNGVGIGNRPLRKGMGLKLMEYRARVINGKLRFRSRPQGGTVVSCLFPKNDNFSEQQNG